MQLKKLLLPVLTFLFITSALKPAQAEESLMVQFNECKKSELPFLGVHASITDLPLSEILAVNNAIKDKPQGSKKLFLDFIKEINLTAFRFYDAYWWSPRGGETTAYNLNRAGMIKDQNVPDSAKKLSEIYITGYNLIDFFGENNLTLVMHVDTMYFDSKLKKSYFTVEVADNPSILEKAAYENAAVFAEYYKKKGYKNRFIIEIGNEGMAYGNDPKPNIKQVSDIVKSYSKAIRKADKNVKISFSSEYHIGYYNKEVYMPFLKGSENNLDYAVFHPYGYNLEWGGNQSGMRNFPLLLGSFTKRLNMAGFKKTGFLLTEYNTREALNKNNMTHKSAVEKFFMIFPAIFYSKVAGAFIHVFPSLEYGNYSDGNHWSTLTSDIFKKVSHTKDINHAKPRWRVLPSGRVHQLFSNALKDSDGVCNIHQKDETKFVILESPDNYKLLIVNKNDSFNNIIFSNRKIKVNKLDGYILENEGKFLDSDHEIEMTGIKKETFSIVNNKLDYSIHPYSVTLILIPKKSIF